MTTKKTTTPETPVNTGLAVIEKKAAVTSPLTAKQRIENMEVFDIIAGKFDFLHDKKKALEKFVVKNEGLSNCKLVLTSTNGTNFEVQNSSIITEIISICSNKLNTLIGDAEKEILTFQI